MSLSKRALDEENEKNSPNNCPNCEYDWNSHFYKYCSDHAEVDHYEEEYFASKGNI